MRRRPSYICRIVAATRVAAGHSTTDLIVGKLYDKTATLTINSYTTPFGNTSPLTAVALVE